MGLGAWSKVRLLERGELEIGPKPEKSTDEEQRFECAKPQSVLLLQIKTEDKKKEGEKFCSYFHFLIYSASRLENEKLDSHIHSGLKLSLAFKFRLRSHLGSSLELGLESSLELGLESSVESGSRFWRGKPTVEAEI